jgi:hypothetical protein
MMESIFSVMATWGPPLQGLVPPATNQFFDWYFYGLNGLGGWLIFFVLALAAVIWLYYDSQKRHLPATGWRIGVLLLLLLLLPTILFRFTVTEAHYRIYRLIVDNPLICPVDTIRATYPEVVFSDCEMLKRSLPPMTPYSEWVFYLGLIGGILAPALAIGYFITFRGMVGCPKGHEPYEQALGECPVCRADEMKRKKEFDELKRKIDQPRDRPVPGNAQPGQQRPATPSRRPLGNAWLLDRANNRRYDLYAGTSRIGRKPENDVMLPDNSVSKSHAMIVEANGHFTLKDDNSSFGTKLNGKKIYNEMSLQDGDEIGLGDTILKFVKA